MHFHFEQIVPVARERVFRFFENPRGIELLYAGWSRIRLLHHEAQIYVGAETWVEVTIAGFIPVVLGFRHTLFEPPTRFAEVIIHGPFSRFTHIHEFIAHDGKTAMRDLLDVSLPGIYGGEAVVRQCVAPTIRRMFRGRAEALIRLANVGTLMSFAFQPNVLPIN